MSYKGIRYEGTIVGKPDIGNKRRSSKLAGLVPKSRPVFRNSDRASTPGYQDPGAFMGINPSEEP